MAKVKEITETKVSDNGEIKSESLIDSITSIEKRIESLTVQHNEAVQKRDQFANLVTRCIGGLEILQGLKKELEPDTDGDN